MKTIDFVKYFVRQWCNAKYSKQGPAIWNQHLALRRTNNVLEGFHPMMSSAIRRTHPNVGEIIEFFKNELIIIGKMPLKGQKGNNMFQSNR